MALRLAADQAHRCGVVRLGRRHIAGRPRSSRASWSIPDGPGGVLVLTGFWALLRADEEARDHRVALQSLVAAWRGAGACCRGCTRDSPCSRRRSGRSFFFASARRKTRQARRSRFSRFRPSVRCCGSASSLRFTAGRSVRRRMVPAATPDRSHSCPGASAACCSISASASLPYAPVLAVAFAGLGAMFLRPDFRRLALETLFVIDAVSAHRHPLRDVVGRFQCAGAVLRAGAAALRHSCRGCVDAFDAPCHAGRRRDRAGPDRFRVGDRRRSSTAAGWRSTRATRRRSGWSGSGASPISRPPHPAGPATPICRCSAPSPSGSAWPLREFCCCASPERRLGRERRPCRRRRRARPYRRDGGVHRRLGRSENERSDHVTIAAAAAEVVSTERRRRRVPAEPLVAAVRSRTCPGGCEPNCRDHCRCSGLPAGRRRRSSRYRPFPRGAIA